MSVLIITRYVTFGVGETVKIKRFSYEKKNVPYFEVYEWRYYQQAKFALCSVQQVSVPTDWYSDHPFLFYVAMVTLSYL